MGLYQTHVHALCSAPNTSRRAPIQSQKGQDRHAQLMSYTGAALHLHRSKFEMIRVSNDCLRKVLRLEAVRIAFCSRARVWCVQRLRHRDTAEYDKDEPIGGDGDVQGKLSTVRLVDTDTVRTLLQLDFPLHIRRKRQTLCGSAVSHPPRQLLLSDRSYVVTYHKLTVEWYLAGKKRKMHSW